MKFVGGVNMQSRPKVSGRETEQEQEERTGKRCTQNGYREKTFKTENITPTFSSYHPTGDQRGLEVTFESGIWKSFHKYELSLWYLFFLINRRIIFHFPITHLDHRIFPRQGELQSHGTPEFHRKAIFKDLDQVIAKPLLYSLFPALPFSSHPLPSSLFRLRGKDSEGQHQPFSEYCPQVGLLGDWTKLSKPGSTKVIYFT